MFEFKLALMYLRKNKRESLSIIACIVIAITLILGVDIGANSIQLNQIKMAREIAGYYDGTLQTDDKKNIEKFKKINGVSNVQTVKNLGEFIPQDGLKTTLYTFNEDYLKSLNYKLVSGRLPKDENEIVIDKSSLDKSYQQKILNKNISAINKIEYSSNGVNKIYSKKNEYKVVGFIGKVDGYYELANAEGNDGIEIASFVKTSQNVLPNELIKYNTVYNLNINEKNLDKKFEYLRKEYNPSLNYKIDIRQDGESGISSNEYLDSALRCYADQQQNNEKELKIFVVVVAAFTIVNFFNIILTKLTSQIGQLRLIGMSNKKVVKFYLIQMLILFIIGSIIGVISSVFFARFGMSMFTTQNMFDISDFTKVKLIIPYSIVGKALIIILAILLLTVLLPILKSLKKYPIDIINKSDKIKYKTKNNKKMIITLLKNNLLRKKSKTIMSIIAISFSGTILIQLIATNLDYLQKQLDQNPSYYPHKYTYNITPHCNADESIKKVSSKDISKLKNIDGIKDFSLESYNTGHLIIKKDKLNKVYSKDFETKDNNTNTQEVVVECSGIDNVNKLSKYVKEGDIKTINKSDGEYINIAVCNRYYDLINAKNTYAIKDLKIGDTFNFKIKSKNSDGNYYYKDFKGKVSVLLDQSYSFNSELSQYSTMGIGMNLKEFKKIVNNNYIEDIRFNAKESSYSTINKVLKDIKKDNSFLNIDNKADNSSKFNISFIHIIFLILLLSALFNIYTTISLNINNNIKEFSILRSIGLPKKSLKKLVIYESIIYAFLGSIVSIIFIAIEDLKYIKHLKEVSAPALQVDLKVRAIYMPPKEAIIFMLIAVLFAFSIGYLKSRSIDKTEIIEGINEN